MKLLKSIETLIHNKIPDETLKFKQYIVKNLWRFGKIKEFGGYADEQ